MFAKNLKKKTPQELLKIIKDLKAELFMLRFKNSTGQLDQPHKINLIKKDIARVFTVLNEKEETQTEKIEKKEKIIKVKNSQSKIKIVPKEKKQEIKEGK